MALIHKGNKQQHVLAHEHHDPLWALQQDLNKTMGHFYDLFDAKHFSLDHFENLKLSPCMDLAETKNCYKIEIEMPGLDEKDIHITIDDNLLTVIGEKTVSKKDEASTFIDREIKYGRYERCITLPKHADLEKVSANFKKGMLWITIPKVVGKKCSSRQVNITRVENKK